MPKMQTYVIRFSPAYGLPDKEVEATDYVKAEEDIIFHNDHCPFYRIGKHYVMSIELKK